MTPSLPTICKDLIAKSEKATASTGYIEHEVAWEGFLAHCCNHAPQIAAKLLEAIEVIKFYCDPVIYDPELFDTSNKPIPVERWTKKARAFLEGVGE